MSRSTMVNAILGDCGNDIDIVFKIAYMNDMEVEVYYYWYFEIE